MQKSWQPPSTLALLSVKAQQVENLMIWRRSALGSYNKNAGYILNLFCRVPLKKKAKRDSKMVKLKKKGVSFALQCVPTNFGYFSYQFEFLLAGGIEIGDGCTSYNMTT